MIGAIFLLITRIFTLIPITVFLVRQAKKFRDPTRDMNLEKTRLGIFIINLSMFTESTLFAVFDAYRIFNESPTITPLWLILLWCTIRVTLVYGIWMLFSILFEKD